MGIATSKEKIIDDCMNKGPKFPGKKKICEIYYKKTQKDKKENSSPSIIDRIKGKGKKLKL